MHDRRLSIWLAAGILVSLAVVNRPAAAEITVSSQSIFRYVYPTKYKVVDPGEPGPTIVLSGLRNGAYSGQVVVSSGSAITGLSAKVSPLTLQQGSGRAGAGTIGADAVQVRWALPDGASSRSGELGYFDSLAESPPAAVPVYKGGLSVQPVWVTVSVPADAAPGDYAGALTLGAEGASAVRVPIKLTVTGWALPNPNQYVADMDIVQSPESVALAYDAEMWSEKHLKLLDKTFSLLAPLGEKTIYISAIRRTHFGNEQAMVRWYRDEKGELAPDFEQVEKYLDVAIPHLGRIPGVVLLCWEPISSMGHAGGAGDASRTTDKPVQYTLWDRKSGQLKKRTGPAWGTPEARVFWKKFTDGIAPVLRKRGLEKSMLFGLIGDARPTKVAMDDICNGVRNARWAVHSHHYAKDWQGYPVGMGIALWGIHLNIVDPARGHGYGWKNPFWLMYYPREFSLQSSPIELHYKLEMWMGAFSLFEMQHQGTSRYARGLGRIGGDFWKVAKDARGRRTATLAGRYPESYWGQLNLNYCLPHILGMGPDGPLATVRSELIREGVQNVEPRVFIEKAIVLDENRAVVGDELAKRARALLDDRIRMVNAGGGPRSDQTTGNKWRTPTLAPDWRQKNEALYRLAVEVAAKLKK